MVRSKSLMAANLEAEYRQSKEKNRGKSKVQSKEDERRRAVIEKRTVWPEKGINLEELKSTFVPEVVRIFRWERVAAQSLPYNEQIVREFYANLVEYEFRHTGRVIVQGVEVVITSERINAFYDLPDLQLSDGLPLPDDGSSFSELAREIRKNGRAGWDAKEDPVKHSELHLEAAFWNKFASHSIKPARHIYTVPLKKMPLLFCLMQRRKVDLGELIFLEIKDASAAHQEGTPILPFPGLISHFCQEAGIDVFVDQGHVFPAAPPIDAYSFNRLLQNHPEIPKIPVRRRRAQTEEDGPEEGPAEQMSQQTEPQLPAFMPFQGTQFSNQASQSSASSQNDQIADLMRQVLDGQVKLGEQLTDVKSNQAEVLSRISALESKVEEHFRHDQQRPEP